MVGTCFISMSKQKWANFLCTCPLRCFRAEIKPPPHSNILPQALFDKIIFNLYFNKPETILFKDLQKTRKNSNLKSTEIIDFILKKSSLTDHYFVSDKKKSLRCLLHLTLIKRLILNKLFFLTAMKCKIPSLVHW